VIVWVVGRSTGGDAFQFQGVFSTETLAVAACRDETYYIGPVTLDESLPHDTIPIWPGARYPLLEATTRWPVEAK
jgi:hypothetical protein